MRRPARGRKRRPGTGRRGSPGRGCRRYCRGTRSTGPRRPGSRRRWRSKSPTMACTPIDGYRVAIASALARSTSSLTSRGTNRSSVPAAASASRSISVFSEVPAPSSTSVLAPVSAAISAESRHEDLALGGRRVVLGQPCDLLEQARATLVVEPDGRQLLRRPAEAPERRVVELCAPVGLVDEDVDADPRLGGATRHAHT